MPKNQNTNFLSTNRATLQIKGLEDLEFSVIGFNLPSIELPVTPVETTFLTGKEAGDKPIYGDVVVTFIVDEDMKNYLAILNWIEALVFHRKDMPRNTDGLITVYSSHNNPLLRIKLYELIPSYVSELPFAEHDTETTPVVVNAHFSLLYFEVEKIGSLS